MPRREDCFLRPMQESDLDLVLQWRNSDRVRRASYTDHIISRDEHLAWFERVRQDVRSAPFVFECETKPVGVVNLTDIDTDGGRCAWGFYVGAEDAPRGVGSAMGFCALEYAFENMGLHRVVGEALADNEASVRYHRRLGFVQEGRFVDHVLKDGEYRDVISFAILEPGWRRIKGELSRRFFESDE